MFWICWFLQSLLWKYFVRTSATCRAMTARYLKGGLELAARALELLGELAKDSETLVREAASEALPAFGGKDGGQLAAQAFELLAVFAKDVLASVRLATCTALSACCEKAIQSSRCGPFNWRPDSAKTRTRTLVRRRARLPRPVATRAD